VLTLLATVSSAATFSYHSTVASSNECGAGGFDSCTLFGSPTIAKYEYDDGVYGGNELNNTSFPSIDGSEFSVSLASNGSGTWSYTPGVGDPVVVTGFVVKAGSGSSGAGYSIYTWDDTSGTDFSSIAWDTSTLRNKALSHITFFDTGATISTIPLPAAGWMLLAGLGGIAALRRRKKG